MKIECSGLNGETFEAEFELEDTIRSHEPFQKVAIAANNVKIEAAQKALETWADMVIKTNQLDKEPHP